MKSVKNACAPEPTVQADQKLELDSSDPMFGHLLTLSDQPGLDGIHLLILEFMLPRMHSHLGPQGVSMLYSFRGDRHMVGSWIMKAELNGSSLRTESR